MKSETLHVLASSALLPTSTSFAFGFPSARSIEAVLALVTQSTMKQCAFRRFNAKAASTGQSSCEAETLASDPACAKLAEFACDDRWEGANGSVNLGRSEGGDGFSARWQVNGEET